MYFVYVLKGISHDKLYKGIAQDIERRLKEHNSGKTKSTKHGRPWKVVYYESYETRAEARKREKYFKSAAGRRFLTKKFQKKEG